MKKNKLGFLCFLYAMLMLLGVVCLPACNNSGNSSADTTPSDNTTPSPDTSSPDVTTPSSPAIKGDITSNYVVITDYVKPNTGEDLKDEIQAVIDANPNRTIFFPDGEYVLRTPIRTSADPKKSVCLLLSDYAIIKAAKNWSSKHAMISLGAKDTEVNDILTAGSCYSLIGGIIDGSGVAKGVDIEAGRETYVSDVSMKNVTIGLHIKYGTNSGSSDADIMNVNIVGTGKKDCIGVLVEGHDNTFTNMRIGKVNKGVKVTGSANMFRNIHPLYFDSGFGDIYLDSVGFWDVNGNNWYDYCYSDQFATAFRLGKNAVSIFDNCQSFWYSPAGDYQVLFDAEGQFASVVTNVRVDFKHTAKFKSVLVTDNDGGKGVISNLVMRKGAEVADEKYLNYLTGAPILFG